MGISELKKTIEVLVLVRVHPANLLNGTIEMLLRKRIELPAISNLRQKIAGSVSQRVHDGLFMDIHERLSEQDRDILDDLLNVPP